MTDIPIAWIRPGSVPRFPPPAQALREPDGLLALGGDLAPPRLLAAYRHGIFPWYGPEEPILWWSPDPRCVFHTDAVHVSRRLRRQLRQCAWTVTIDQAFTEVMQRCAAPRAGQGGGTWIVDDMLDAYTTLHRQGHAHSIEVWDGKRMVGGLYGVAVGRLFCGESMFSEVSGGSKAALVCLAALLQRWNMPLLDAQVGNGHLYRMGAMDMSRDAFLDQLALLASAQPDAGAFRLDDPLPVAAFMEGAGAA
ncbi:MAG TPA: leucyl/phenylalanyl-tRNA--protein transferase [Oleiagrimonas sp.]|nr:leucyl/phenylalanyl-tRNA--protein transferase [Oleiagrimonas sp.]